MNREEEEEYIKKRTTELIEIQLDAFDKHSTEYEKIKQKTLDFIAMLEKQGLEVESYSIKKIGGINGII